MKAIYLVPILLVLSACSQIIHKYPVVKKSPVNTAEIQVSKTEAKVDTAKDCVHLIVFIPTQFFYDTKKLYEDVCPASDYLYDVELVREFWFIPLIYGQDCYKLKAKCEK